MGQLKLTYPLSAGYTKAEVDSKDQTLLVNFYTQLVTTSGDLVSQIPTDYITHVELTTTSGDIVAQFPSLASYATEDWVNQLLVTTSGDIIDQIPSLSGYATEVWVNDGFVSDETMTSISGDLIAQIPIDYVSNSEMTTISGDLVAQIEAGDVSQAELLTTSGDIVVQIPSLAGYATEAWVNIYVTTTSGDIVAQIPIDYITLQKLTTTSGDIVAQIPSLSGYATEGWVTNQGYATVIQLTTTSGDIIAQIPSLVGYATESWVNSNFPDNVEITTVSGDIISQIPSLAGYATQSWVSDNYIDNSEMTTISGDIVVQIPSLVGYATESWVNLGFISNEEMTTISGDLVAQMGAGGITLEQLTTTSGDIVDQIPSLAGYATETWVELGFISNEEMTTISGDLVSQMGAGGVTLEQLTTTSGDIIVYVDQQISGISINTGYYENVSTGSGNFSAEGTTIDHYLDTENHFVSVIPTVTGTEQAAKIGTVYATLGINSDIIYCTGQGDAEGFPFFWIATASGSQTGIECITCSGNDLYVTRNITAVSGTFTEGIKVGNDSLHITTSGIIFPDRTEITSTEGLGGGGVTPEQLTTTSGDLILQMFVGSDWEPPDIKRRNTSELWIEKGKYYKAGYKYRGHYQDLDGLCQYWVVPEKFAVTATGTYSAGISSGMVGGPSSSSLYTAFLVGNNEVMITPYVLAYGVTASGGNTQITLANQGTLLKSGIWNIDLNGATAIANYTIRVLLPAVDIWYDGTKIRIQIQGHSTTPNSFDHISIVERSGTTSNGTTTPTEILFNGTSGLSLAAAATATSDWTAFTIDATKSYLVIFDVSATAQNQRASQNGWSNKVTYYKAATDSWDQQNLSGASSTGEVWFCIGLEVMQPSNSYVTSSGIFNDYRLLKISNDDYDGNIYTISDSVDTINDYLEISSDKTAEITTTSWYKILPPAGLDFVELGIIRYSGTSITNFKKTKNEYTWLAAMPLGNGDVNSYSISSISTNSTIPPDANVVSMLASAFSSTASTYALFLELKDASGYTHAVLGDRVVTTGYTNIEKLFSTYPFDTPGVIYHRGYHWNSSYSAVTPYTGAQVQFFILGWRM